MSEIQRLMDRWLAKTLEVLKYELQQKGVGVSDELYQSLDENLTTLTDGYLRGEISFLTRGRFVDMGAGRGYSAGGKRIGGEAVRGRKGRKPKKWYNRAMYGRLNDLQGAVGFKLMEQAVDSIKGPLKGLK